MAEIKVDSAALRSSASVLLGEAGKFNSLVNDIKTGMQTMKNEWMGSAADAFINKFNALTTNFDAYFKTINDYGNFLNTAAAEFDATEGKVTSDQDSPLNSSNLASS